YLLGLSHIDPIANKLFLGRFLNETLASVPDIDLDFPREIREELIRRVYTRYGAEYVGLVCSFPTYRLRSAVREIGKALDLPLGMVWLEEEYVQLSARRTGTAPDLPRINFEDPAIYGRICTGDTIGLFQIESRAQIQMIRRSRPRNLEDLAVEVAIVRPGPIV